MNTVGANKAIAAGLAGAIVTIAAYVLSIYKINPPAEVLTAAQTVIVALLVYFVPHGSTGK